MKIVSRQVLRNLPQPRCHLSILHVRARGGWIAIGKVATTDVLKIRMGSDVTGGGRTLLNTLNEEATIKPKGRLLPTGKVSGNVGPNSTGMHNIGCRTGALEAASQLVGMQTQ